MRILKISQQAEVQVLVPIGEESDFERLDQFLDAVRAAGAASGPRPGCAMSDGMPSEKSIRGRGCGVISDVASQFTSVTAS